MPYFLGYELLYFFYCQMCTGDVTNKPPTLVNKPL